jgi:hypothetical protein
MGNAPDAFGRPLRFLGRTTVNRIQMRYTVKTVFARVTINRGPMRLNLTVRYRFAS